MKIFKILAVVGIFLIVGAADAADSNSITYQEMLRQMLMGSGITAVGVFLAKHTAPKPKRRRRAEVVSIEQLKQAG